jgi:hypothetical protein
MISHPEIARRVASEHIDDLLGEARDARLVRAARHARRAVRRHHPTHPEPALTHPATAHCPGRETEALTAPHALLPHLIPAKATKG